MNNISKINKKILNCHLLLSAIYDLTCRLVENVSQEDLDSLSEVLEQYSNVNVALQNSIKTFILEIAEVPTEEIDVEPEENGLKV